MIGNEKFFGELFGDRKVCFRFLHEEGHGNVSLTDYISQKTFKKIEKYNEQGYDAYFVVNSGGFKDKEITKFNAVFIDLDCGRDEANNYFPLDVVSAYKVRKLEQIRRYVHQPTAMVETRNGLHGYWLLNDNATIEQFLECMARLISYFDADRMVRNPANLMRVPNYYWSKSGYDKFMVEIIMHNAVRYDITTIIDSLPAFNTGGFGDSNKKKDNILLFIADSKTHMDNISLIKERNVEVLQNRLKPEPISFNSHHEVYNHLKQQDLHNFLGLFGQPFTCIFHKDKRPSASIFTNTENGHFIYKCHSKSCDWAGTIIQVTEKLLGVKQASDALQLLRKVFKVDYVETNWQQQQKAILTENQRFLMSEDLADFYPQIYALIKHYVRDLDRLIRFAKEKVFTENFCDANGNPIFFISNRHMAKIFGKDDAAVSKRIGLLTYLGLLNKLRDEQIPKHLLERAKQEATKKKQRYIVTFYSIPDYGELTLSFSRNKAKEYKEKNFTKRGWGREMLLRALGEQEADRVFPQLKGHQLSEANEQVAHELEKVALYLIQYKGWTTETEILFSINGLGGRKYSTEQWKKILPEFLDKYCVVKKPLNKQFKVKYDIQLKGYPRIFFREQHDVTISREVKGVKITDVFQKLLSERLIRSTDDSRSWQIIWS